MEVVLSKVETWYPRRDLVSCVVPVVAVNSRSPLARKNEQQYIAIEHCRMIHTP